MHPGPPAHRSGGISQFFPATRIGEAPILWRDIDQMKSDGRAVVTRCGDEREGRGRILTVFYYGKRT